MRHVIIGIHGLGNKPSEQLLRTWWLDSIKEGFARAGFELPDFDFELVYWADLLHPQPKDPDVEDPGDPRYLEAPYIPSPELTERQPRKFRRHVLEAIERVLDKLMMNEDFTLNYEHIADSLIHHYFKDLEAYYASPAEGVMDDKPSVKMLIRERLASRLRAHRNDRVMLIAHSMGSIVAYDVLDLNPDLNVDTLVTIGSPLGLPVVMGRIAAEHRNEVTSPRTLRTPPTISTAWHNFADLEDKVAFNFTLADDYVRNVTGVKPVDHEIVNDYQYGEERNPHKVYGYLRAPEVTLLLHGFLAAPLPSGWQRLLRRVGDWWEGLFSKREPLPDPPPLPTGPASAETELVEQLSSLPELFTRDRMLVQLRAHLEPWDIVVIGGGATGMGVAVEAASRGYKTLLLEQHDFGKGTSSRSTKLVHGGVRYLQQGNVSLVLEALRERAIMRDNAPHLVSDLPFIVPIYDWWEGPFYGIGLRLYDMLAGKHGFGDSRNLSREETIARIPVIETEGLRGGVIYHDGQFDDSRLVINLAQTAAEEGAVLLNYAKVTGLKQVDGSIQGVVVHDEEAGEEFHVEARAVINATGVFTDSIRHMDDQNLPPVIQPSRGIHIVLDRSFLGGDTAIMVPHTDDGRVLFAIPWHDKVIFGTTDTPVDTPDLEPHASREEFDFLLEHAARYLVNDPTEKDVLSVFAGLRPLVNEGEAGSTSSISRDHSILISRSGLVTIAGGKWTTYRHMAEETIDQAIAVGQLQHVPSLSRDLPIHGWHQRAVEYHSLSMYGADAPALLRMIDKHPGQGTLMHPNLPITEAQVIWAARAEMARTVEDVLARRTRCLLLGARASIEIAPKVASILARELGYGRKWQAEQIDAYEAMALGYLPEGLE